MEEDIKKFVEDVKKYGKVEGNNLIIDDGIQRQKIGEIKEKQPELKQKLKELEKGK